MYRAYYSSYCLEAALPIRYLAKQHRQFFYQVHHRHCIHILNQHLRTHSQRIFLRFIVSIAHSISIHISDIRIIILRKYNMPSMQYIFSFLSVHDFPLLLQ